MHDESRLSLSANQSSRLSAVILKWFMQNRCEVRARLAAPSNNTGYLYVW